MNRPLARGRLATTLARTRLCDDSVLSARHYFRRLLSRFGAPSVNMSLSSSLQCCRGDERAAAGIGTLCTERAERTILKDKKSAAHHYLIGSGTRPGNCAHCEHGNRAQAQATPDEPWRARCAES